MATAICSGNQAEAVTGKTLPGKSQAKTTDRAPKALRAQRAGNCGKT